MIQYQNLQKQINKNKQLKIKVMSLSLSKGQKLNLSKENPSMKSCFIGLGWDAKAETVAGNEFDLDASVLLVGNDGKAKETDFVFYNQLVHGSGSVRHLGDNRTGAGDGDDEVVEFDLDKIPVEYSKAVVVVTIHDSSSRRQTFGDVENSYCRLVNKHDGKELLKFELDFDASTATGVQFCSLIRRNESWHFSADQTEFPGGLAGFLQKYGIETE